MENIKSSNNRVNISESNISIVRDESKCKNCGMCKLVCNREVGVDGYFNKNKPNEQICINCGQCVLACPFGALQVVGQTDRVGRALGEGKIVVFSISPAVRVAIGEMFGLPAGKNLEKKIVSALRLLGASFVFDTTFGADLVVMEEATELVARIKSKKLPLFTSCCPAWVSYVENFIPKKLSHLSSARSPIAMQGTMIKTYFAKENKIDPEQIFSVAIAPCSAKKAEFCGPHMNKSGQFWNKPHIKDIDAVITTTELGQMLKDAGIDVSNAKNSDFDCLLGKGSGAGVLFGTSGGVLEAVLRTAYYLLNGQDAPQKFFELQKKRGKESVFQTQVDLGETMINVAVICGTAKAREFLISNSSNLPDFVEVMCCPNGCVGGAGQPNLDRQTIGETRALRSKGLSASDKKQKVRASYQNPEIQRVYKRFLKKPMSKISKQLLHTDHKKPD